MPTTVEFPGLLIVIVAHLFSKVTASAVEHYPKISVLVTLQFDEMVAASERSNLLQCGLVLTLYHGHGLNVVTLRHQGLVLSHLMAAHTDWDTFAHTTKYLLAKHFLRDVLDFQGGLDCTHAATYINTYGIGYHHILCRKDAANRHTFTAMGIRHQGNMPEYKRQ